MFKKSICLNIFFLLLFSSCATESIQLSIFHTNDHHGHYWQDSKGQMGMAARSTLLKQKRKESEESNTFSLLLSGGDINTGTMESDIYNAEPDFKGMHYLKYDAMAIGNHEFDNALTTLLKQSELAGFPFLSANIRWKSGPNKGQRVFNKPLYLVKKFHTFKIGIFGLTTKDTYMKASNDDSRELVIFTPIIKEAKEVVAQMKKDGVDFIIAVTHVGHKGSNTANGDVDLAKAVDGIDVIVGGHSQEIIKAQKVNNAIIVQAKEWGKFLGHLKLKITRNTFNGIGKQMLVPYELIPINLKNKVINSKGEKTYVYQEQEINEDAKLLKLLRPYYKGAEKAAAKVVGKSRADFNFSHIKVRSKQTPLGQLVALAMKAKAKSDIAFVNGGGVRGNIDVGPITYKQIHEIHPFGNSIATLNLSAPELFSYVEKNIELFFNESGRVSKDLSGGYPQIAGLKIYLHKGKLLKLSSFSAQNYWEINKEGNQIKSKGKDSFIIALSTFSANGGDGLPVLSDHASFEDTGFSIDNALANYLQNDLKSIKNPVHPSTYKKSAIQVIQRM